MTRTTTMSEASAARDYFDPRDPEPTCDICDQPWNHPDDFEPWEDWNGDTGCHRTCEERQHDKEDEPYGGWSGVDHPMPNQADARVEPSYVRGPTCPACGGPPDFHATICPELRL
jgi:hypothetical protein